MACPRCKESKGYPGCQTRCEGTGAVIQGSNSRDQWHGRAWPSMAPEVTSGCDPTGRIKRKQLIRGGDWSRTRGGRASGQSARWRNCFWYSRHVRCAFNKGFFFMSMREVRPLSRAESRLGLSAAVQSIRELISRQFSDGYIRGGLSDPGQ